LFDALDPADMLAYVIVHEVVHLLLPLRSHSPVGIMRERWTREDFALMSRRNLAFMPASAKLIKKELLRLSQRR